MKRIKCIAIVLSVVLVFCNTPLAHANTIQSGQIEYEDQVAQIMKSYKADPEAAQLALDAIDTELVALPTTVNHYSNSNSRGTSPSDYTLQVYSFKKSGSSVTYLQWLLTVNAKEWFPGPLDYISLEWDTAYASYYASSGDGEFSTVQGRNDGIVLFNLEDNQLGADDTSYGTVQVYRSQSGWMDFGSKFAHTYTSLVASGSASISYAPSASIAANGGLSLGLSYTYGYNVNIGSSTNKWEIWNDNSVQIS